MMEWVIDFLQRFATELVNLTNEMSFWLLLGFFIAGILYAWFPQHKIKKYLGSQNSRSVINSALLGVPLPLCSCGVIPTGVSFYKNGASKGSAVSFLISTPQTGVDSIMVTYSMLGLPFAIIRPIIAFVTGVVGGLITNFSDKKNSVSDDTKGFETKPDTRNPIVKMFHYAFVEFLQDIAKWLVIGVLIAAVIAVVVPNDFFSQYITNDFLGMLIILLVSIPLYVCATSSVPIAAVLLLKGLSPGAALVFLMAGPATNAATITVIGKSMGKKTLYAYLGSIIGGALFFGLGIDYLIPREWFLNALPVVSMHHNHGLIPIWLKYASSITLTLLVAYSFIRKFLPKTEHKHTKEAVVTKIPGMEQIKVIVKGMECRHCQANVENSLKTVSGINRVDANVDKEEVTLTLTEFNEEIIKSTIEGIGYSYGGVIRE